LVNKVEINKSKLEGCISISGAKNSALKLLAASILSSEDIVLTNMPSEILDLKITLKMLEQLGKRVYIENKTIKISEENTETSLHWEKRSIRTTLLLLGSLLTRFGYGKVPIPGGCNIGLRKYDLHLMAIKKFGGRVWEENGYLYAETERRLKGTDIYLPIKSTGATENAVLMGVLAEGTTTIWNPHIRPEIIDLVSLLNKMGAKILVKGQESIRIKGVKKLNGAQHECIPDNLEALTFTIGAAVTGGELEIKNFPLKHLEIPLIHLRESGLKYFISEDYNSIIVKKSNIYPVEIATGPYPSINSDMQPIFAVFGMLANGISKIIDLRFPDRFQYTEELSKMGGKFEIKNNMLKIFGKCSLKGDSVKAMDLRAGAALVLSGLVADGTTEIYNFSQVERGYDDIIQKIKSIGGLINPK